MNCHGCHRLQLKILLIIRFSRANIIAILLNVKYVFFLSLFVNNFFFPKSLKCMYQNDMLTGLFGLDTHTRKQHGLQYDRSESREDVSICDRTEHQER